LYRPRPASERSGTSMVEFALTLPLLAVLLFGIIQYGFIFADYMTIRNASAVAARYATLSPTPTIAEIQSVAQTTAEAELGTNNVPTVNVNMNVAVGSFDDGKQVQVVYNVPLIIPFVVPGKTDGGSLTISATTVAR